MAFEILTVEQMIQRGLTVKGFTSVMRTHERIINFFNKKYDYDMDKATDKDRREWQRSLDTWDGLKVNRDTLKAAL